MFAPPPKTYFLHPFVCPKFYQKIFCIIKKKNRKITNHQKKQKNKKNKKKQKKQTNQNPEGNVSARVSPESLVFLFFLFFFVFLFFSFFFGFFGLRLLRTYFCKKKALTFHYKPLVFTISLRKQFFPKYFRQFILNFFL